MFDRLFILKLASILFVYILIAGHSPWGQYHAYRQQHLLIMSTREDAPTYPFSKQLIEIINQELPEASARPARARTFKRVQSLLSTGQIPLLLLSKKNARALIQGIGPFRKFGKTKSFVIYNFGDLVLLTEPNFPNRHAWQLTKVFMDPVSKSIGAKSPLKTRQIADIHEGTMMALNGESIPELNE